MRRNSKSSKSQGFIFFFGGSGIVESKKGTCYDQFEDNFYIYDRDKQTTTTLNDDDDDG